MTQRWHDLLFIHLPLAPDMLRPLLPAQLELDTFDGQAWVGIIPFWVSHASLRWVPPPPLLSRFPEINVRTYVTLRGIPGVYFFSLDAGNSVAVGAARTLLNLPYYSAQMAADVHDNDVRYSSRRIAETDAAFEARYRGLGDTRKAPSGTLEHFLTERYCLYAVDHTFHAYRLEIHHPPWPLESAEADITTNTMADAAGIRLPSLAPLLHFAKRQDMVCWAPERL